MHNLQNGSYSHTKCHQRILNSWELLINKSFVTIETTILILREKQQNDPHNVPIVTSSHTDFNQPSFNSSQIAGITETSCEPYSNYFRYHITASSIP